MPHLILTHSKKINNFNYKSFLNELYDCLSGFAPTALIAGRVYLPDLEFIGDHSPNNLFMSLTLKVLKKPDRTPGVKDKLAQKITKILAKYTKQAINELNESNADKNNNFNCPVMVEIVDLTDSYKREELG